MISGNLISGNLQIKFMFKLAARTQVLTLCVRVRYVSNTLTKISTILIEGPQFAREVGNHDNSNK